MPWGAAQCVDFTQVPAPSTGSYGRLASSKHRSGCLAASKGTACAGRWGLSGWVGPQAGSTGAWQHFWERACCSSGVGHACCTATAWSPAAYSSACAGIWGGIVQQMCVLGEGLLQLRSRPCLLHSNCLESCCLQLCMRWHMGWHCAANVSCALHQVHKVWWWWRSHRWASPASACQKLFPRTTRMVRS